MQIDGIGSYNFTDFGAPKLPENKSGNVSFQEIFEDSLSEVNELQQESQTLNEKLVSGEVDNLHDVVIASEKADLALNLTIQIRDSLVESYQEIMRMQI